jgi:hypothetical protein
MTIQVIFSLQQLTTVFIALISDKLKAIAGLVHGMSLCLMQVNVAASTDLTAP